MPTAIQKACIFAMHSMRLGQRKEWEIWAAKTQDCETCKQPIGKPCLNLSDIKSGKTNPRIVSHPHEGRISWGKLFSGLQQRGYIK